MYIRTFARPCDQWILASDFGPILPIPARPCGHWIMGFEYWPILPLPSRVQVTNEFIEIDGWLFSLADVTKRHLDWFSALLVRWSKEDGSDENRQWLAGILEALYDVLIEKP